MNCRSQNIFVNLNFLIIDDLNSVFFCKRSNYLVKMYNIYYGIRFRLSMHHNCKIEF